MRKPAISAVAKRPLPLPDTSAHWICLALGLAILTLSLRIFSVW
jgi:hypothetical protein